MKERTKLINKLIDLYSYSFYLEIGVDKNQNFKNIKCPYKIGVDSNPNSKGTTYYMTSDKFFEQNNETFDIIFIDGLHRREQVKKDILNSLDVLNENGTIICHDINPPSYETQVVPRKQGKWTGDCWKAFVYLRCNRDDLYMVTVNVETGCGVIRRGVQNPLTGVTENDLTYENLKNNRKEWLNLMSKEEFFEKLKKEK